MFGKLCAVNLKCGIKRNHTCALKSILYVLCFLCVFVAVSCSAALADLKNRGGSSANDKSGGKPVSIISWNLQNFFDGVENGSEYAQFRGSKSAWTEEKYVQRLDRLCDFITNTNADIYVFQEFENEDILQDVANRLAGGIFSARFWSYGSFASQKGSALGLAVLSRLPLTNSCVHQLDLRAVQNEKNEKGVSRLTPAQLRPILETTVETQNAPVTLFVCHWKSKRGTKAQSRYWQSAQERLLANRIVDVYQKNQNAAVIACGDFNRALEDFTAPLISDIASTCAASGGTASFITLRGRQNIDLVSAWLFFDAQRASASPQIDESLYENALHDFDGEFSEASGSYYFKGQWEKIDHFFYNTKVNALEFQPLMSGSHIQNGVPYRYDIQSGEGYSDHVPLLFVFSL